MSNKYSNTTTTASTTNDMYYRRLQTVAILTSDDETTLSDFDRGVLEGQLKTANGLFDAMCFQVITVSNIVLGRFDAQDNIIALLHREVQLERNLRIQMEKQLVQLLQEQATGAGHAAGSAAVDDDENDSKPSAKSNQKRRLTSTAAERSTAKHIKN
jgi:hypothetical protein